MEYNNVNNTTSRSSSNVAILFAILLFLRCVPYYFWDIEDISRITCSILIPLLCIAYLKYDKWNIIIFFTFLLSFIFLGIARGNDFIGFANILALSLIPLLKKDFLITVFKYFKYIFSFFLLLSLINYLLVLLFDIQPSGMIDPINTLKNYRYSTHLFLVIPEVQHYQFRFFGLFDEPGFIGTVSAIFLFADKFKIKGWQNITLLIGGFLSFSFFFYLICLFFILLIFKTKFFPLLIISILIIYFNTYDSLYDYIWWRFEWAPYKGSFIGDNRANINVIRDVSDLLFTHNFFFGSSNDYPSYFLGEASIYIAIYRYGALFVFTNIAGYVILAYKHLRQQKYMLFIVLSFIIFTFYQRPSLFDHVYIFLFTAIINITADKEYLKYNER